MNLHAERTINQYYPTRYKVTIIGSFIQRTAFPKVVRALEAGLVPVERLITHRIPLSDLGEGLEALRSGAAIKCSFILEALQPYRRLSSLRRTCYSTNTVYQAYLPMYVLPLMFRVTKASAD